MHGARYIHRYIRIVFSVFANQGVVEGLSTLWSSKRKHPVCFLRGPSMVFNSLDFNVVLYELQSWERTALVTLPWRGRFYFPYKVKSGNSFSQHPVACGFAKGGLLISKAVQGASGAMGTAVLCACRSQPS